MNRVAIVGASGFVGSTLAEALAADGVPVRCLIHSAGNAWRLARHPMDLKLVDLMDPASIREAIAGCSCVVNCSRGKTDVMLEGMKNLLDACREVGPDRFVHISSVAVYGDKFSVPAIDESCAGSPEKGTYGWKKLKQDEMVVRAARSGLNSVVVCPPNISGPYSMFWDEISKSIRSGTFAWVDKGALPCPLIDVHNLVYAIRLGMDSDASDGRRFFVCDDPTATWSDVANSLTEMLGIDREIPSYSIEEATAMVESQNPQPGSLKKTVGHLVSSDVRSSLRQDPYIGGIEKFAVGWAKRMPQSIQDRLRDERGPRVAKSKSRREVSVRLLAQQLRNITYSCASAKKTLNYQPPVGLAASIAGYQEFARTHWGLGSEPYQLLLQLG